MEERYQPGSVKNVAKVKDDRHNPLSLAAVHHASLSGPFQRVVNCSG